MKQFLIQLINAMASIHQLNKCKRWISINTINWWWIIKIKKRAKYADRIAHFQYIHLQKHLMQLLNHRMLNYLYINYQKIVMKHLQLIKHMWYVTRIEMISISKDENDYVNGCPCTNILLNITNPSLFFVFVLYIFIYL